MAYAYEDDDEIITNEEDDEELDENLNVKKKSIKKKKKVEESEKNVENKLSVDDLLAIDDNKEYSIDELLKEEQEKEEINYNWDDLLTKKDDKLFRLYLASGYKNITSKQFNYAALFLGPIYLLYRKVYLIGFVWLFLDLFTLFLLPLAKVKYVIIIIFEILSFICAGVFSNQIILNHVGTKIINYKVIEEDKEKLREVVKKRGGTNLPLALVVFIIVVSGIVMSFWGPITKLLTSLNNTNTPTPSTNERVYFDGIVNVDENIKISDKVTMKVPDNFYLVNDFDYKYYYVYDDPNAYLPLCTIELDKVLGYKTPELFISAIAKYHLELNENIQIKESNNYVWKYINVTDASKNIYYATTLIDNDMYLLKLTYQYKLESECGSHFEAILDSIDKL